MLLMGSMLVVASWTDLRWHRIPNILTFSCAAALLVLQAYDGGLTNFVWSLAGLAVGLVLLLPFYLGGGMAAGDVKLMAAVGAALGPELTAYAVACTLMAGGALAIVVIIARGGTNATFQRYVHMLKVLFTTQQWIYLPPAQGEVVKTRFPYALAIAVGTVVAVWWQTNTLLGWPL